MTNAIATATATAAVTRDATAQDARDLLVGYKMLVGAKRAFTKAVKAVDEGWIDGDTDVLRAERDTAQCQFDAALNSVWIGLATLPRGTVAPGGMTPQTVGLEFFNRNLNRDGGRRLTAAQARKINVLSASL